MATLLNSQKRDLPDSANAHFRVIRNTASAESTESSAMAETHNGAQRHNGAVVPLCAVAYFIWTAASATENRMSYLYCIPPLALYLLANYSIISDDCR